MEIGPHEFVLRDEPRSITYVVRSFREISRGEALAMLRAFRSSREGRKVRRGHRYEIHTSIGHAD